MPLSTALLLDADPKSREALTYGFVNDGIAVRAAESVSQAIGLLGTQRPELVVLVVREPARATLDFLQNLRAKPAPQAIPVLALGTQVHERDVRALGVPFLPLPSFMRDAVTAAKVLAATTPSVEADTEGELHGRVADFGMFYLLRTLMGLGRSGIVHVERGPRKGELRLDEGGVVAAQVGTLDAQAALHQLLLWEDATLAIKFRNVVRRGQGFKKGEELIDELERYLRDFAYTTRPLGPVQSVFEPIPEAEHSEVDPNAVELAPVLRLFDGHRSLGDVIEESPYRVFDTVRIVNRLVSLNALRRSSTAGGPPETPPSRRFPVDEPSTGTTPVNGIPVASTPESTDQRSGTADRRKAPRPERRITGEFSVYAPRAVPAAAATPPVRATPASTPVVPEAAAPRAAQPETRSGALQARGELRASRRNLPAMPTDVPSVVVDLGADVPGRAAGADAVPAHPASQSASGLHIVRSTAPASVPVAPPGASIQVDASLLAESGAAPTTTQPGPRPAAVPVPVPAVATAPMFAPPAAVVKARPSRPVPVAAAAAPSSPVPTPVKARPSAPVLVAPAAPPAATGTPAALPPGHAAAQSAHAAGPTAVYPAPTASAPPAAAAAPHPAPSAHAHPAPVPHAPAVGSAVQSGIPATAASHAPAAHAAPASAGYTAPIPPAHAPVATVIISPPPAAVATAVGSGTIRATGSVTVTPAPKSNAGSPSTNAAPPASVQSRAVPSAPADASDSARRPSAEFDALEADFFAREADLYKSEKLESFDDLDGGGYRGSRGPRGR